MGKRFTAVALGAALAVLVAMPVLGSQARPTSGRFTAQAVPAEPRCGTDALTLGFEIQGTAAQLGVLTGVGSNCTEPTLTTEAVDIWDGVALFTASDGSTLTSVGSGSQDSPIAGRAAFTVTYSITGGTGRFAGASGEWIVTGIIDFTTGQLVGEMTGWLAY